MDRSRVELANLLARRREGKGLLRCCNPVSTITSLKITGQAPHTFPSQDLSESVPGRATRLSGLRESDRYLDTRRIAAPGPWNAGGSEF